MYENIFANVKKGTPVEVYAEWQDGLYVWHAGWAFQGMSGSEVVVGQTGQPRVHGTFRENRKTSVWQRVTVYPDQPPRPSAAPYGSAVGAWGVRGD